MAPWNKIVSKLKAFLYNIALRTIAPNEALGMIKTNITDRVVLGVCGLLTVVLVLATWNIHFFPSDEKHYFFSAALRLPHLNYLSEIHKGVDSADDVFLHGKEVLVLLFALMQNALRDHTTVRPLMLVIILAFGASGLLIYHIAKNYWGRAIALVVFGVFMTCLWPYVYVLFPRHQPLGLFFVLLAIFILQQARHPTTRDLLLFLSGSSLSCALYSSTVTAAYFPFFLAAFGVASLAAHATGRPQEIPRIAKDALLILVGFLVPFLAINAPDITGNIKNYLRYIQISSSINHFYYNQPMLQQWFSGPMIGIRGGWAWVASYLFLVLPVLFPVCLLLFFYVLSAIARSRSRGFQLQNAGLLLLSLSPLFLAEIKGVAQYGANYFPALLGFLLLLGQGLFLLEQKYISGAFSLRSRRRLVAAGLLALGLHIGVNAYLLFTDVFPSRMATALISDKLRSLNVQEVYVHPHPLRGVFCDNLDPELLKKITFVPITNIYWPSAGYIFLPPVAGRTLFNCCFSYDDFDDDVYLNELIKQDALGRYAVASFKTVASSKIWSQEEEILSYMHLILRQFSPEDLKRGKAWILDARKLRQDLAQNLPRKEYVDLLLNGVENIGTRENIYHYQGAFQRFLSPATVEKMTVPLTKVGDPQDSLVLYVFKRNPQNGFFFPCGRDYASVPLPAAAIPAEQNQGAAPFTFKKPLALEPGDYYFSIFRTGKTSDQDYYQILSDPDRQKISSLLIPGLPAPGNP